MGNFLKRSAAFWATIAPGIFLVGYNVGTGSITTMASAGAHYGMSLTWALLLSCLFTYVMVVAFGKYTMVTGKTALFGFRQAFGKPVTVFLMTSLLLAEVVSCMGVMGVVTEVIREWSRPLTADGQGFSMFWMALLFCVMLYYVFWQGKQSIFEKILAIFVCIMGLSFLITMFMVIPQPAEIIRGLVPMLPDDTNSFLLVAGMVGTTMGAILYVVRSITIKDKGWTVGQMKIQRRDARISIGMMFVLSFALMACAAGTMFPEGLRVDKAIDMVILMEPLAGRLAVSVFVAGIVAAGLSSLLPIIILAPWLMTDFMGVKPDLTRPWVRIIVLAVTLCGLVVPVFGGSPVFVMIFSQSLCLFASPFVILFMVILLNRKKEMGEYTPNVWQNILYGIVFLFTVVISVVGVVGMVKM